jgi:hypothetical protein
MAMKKAKKGVRKSKGMKRPKPLNPVKALMGNGKHIPHVTL